MKRLFSILLFFLIIILAFYIWYPEYQEYQEKREVLERAEEALERLESALTELKETERELGQYQEAVSKLEVALPKEPLITFSVLDVQVFLRETTKEYGLFLGSIETEEIGSESIIIDLSLSGSYREFFAFLSFLQKNYKIFEIGDFSLSVGEEEEDLWDFGLTLTTHSLSEEEKEMEIVETTYY